eukprot:1264636-Prymnesium_polylepis.1
MKCPYRCRDWSRVSVGCRRPGWAGEGAGLPFEAGASKAVQPLFLWSALVAVHTLFHASRV